MRRTDRMTPGSASPPGAEIVPDSAPDRAAPMDDQLPRFPSAACLIDGVWRPAHRGGAFAVVNPSTDEVVGAAADAGAEEANAALDAAAAALPRWRETPGPERAAALRRWAAALGRHREELAHLLTLEQGKPLLESRGEIDYARSFFDFAAGEAERLGGELIPASTAGKRLLVLRPPVGVCAAITPWNFPAAMVARKLAPALAAGCTMVLKPAEQTPLTALALASLAEGAGVPAGVVNVVTGDAERIGSAFFAHGAVRKVSFTGSTEVGRLLIERSAPNIVRLALELGGHAPLIVFDDADLARALDGAIASKFRNGGQTCICANRFYVQESIHDAFVAGLRERVAALRVGDGRDPTTQIGPLIDDAALRKVEAHVADATARGARATVGGGLVEIPGLARRFHAPTVLEGATPEMLVLREETFGPVAPVVRFRDEVEAIALANSLPFGLAAYFFTRDASRLLRVAEALEFGVLGANDAMPSTAQAPFGGMRHSGYGREGGREGVLAFTETKYLCWGL